jgi:peptide/nickel transport system permease protein
VTGRTLRSVGSRVASAALVLWGAVTLAFAALHLMPGDPVDAVVGGANQVTPELRAEIVRAYALDRPLVVQYLDYVGRLLRGDLGESFALRMPVVDAIGQQLVPTLTLLVAATALALAVAMVVALLTAHRPGWIRGLCSTAEVVGVGVPAFWLAILLLTLFSFQLGWFPAIGDTGFAGSVLPVVALTVAPAGVLTRLLRRELERTLDEPFVVTARARGLTEAAVRVRHVLRHALIPVITLAGWLAGTMIGGAVVIEKVFSRPGLGRLTVEAVDHKDVPLVLGVVLVAAAFYVAVNLATDVLYRLVDPRLRDEEWSR